MRVFLILALLVLSAGNVLAQERLGVPSSAPRERSVRAAPEIIPKVTPKFIPELTSVTGSCVRLGDMLTIRGTHLDRLGDKIPALDILGKAVPLKVISKTPERFVIQLLHDHIEPDKNYEIVLADKNNLQGFKNTNLNLRVCPSPIVEQQTVSTLDILIFADLNLEEAITRELESRNIRVIRAHALNALESVMFVINGDGNLINDLRAKFPDAEIDANTDLSGAKGPRLYAKDKIEWPEKGSCLAKAIAIPIGLIDGSIDRTHSAFAGQEISEKSFLNGQQADKSHATAIASILIGNAPIKGFDGLLTGARLHNAVVLRHTPDNQFLASTEAVLRGLDWLMSKDIRLINVSLAGKRNRVLVKSFKKALGRGALIFAAAGNNGPSAKPVYPAAIKGVFAITAIDAAGRRYKAANRGDYIDLFAPGVDIWAAAPSDLGAYKSGTSFATPYAVASAALHLARNAQLSEVLLLKVLSKNEGRVFAFCP